MRSDLATFAGPGDLGALEGCNVGLGPFTVDACAAADWILQKAKAGGEALWNAVAGEDTPKTKGAAEDAIRALAARIAAAPKQLAARDITAYTVQITDWLAMAQAAEAEGDLAAAGAFANMILSLSERVTGWWLDEKGERVSWLKTSWLKEAERIRKASVVAAEAGPIDTGRTAAATDKEKADADGWTNWQTAGAIALAVAVVAGAVYATR